MIWERNGNFSSADFDLFVENDTTIYRLFLRLVHGSRSPCYKSELHNTFVNRTIFIEPTNFSNPSSKTNYLHNHNCCLYFFIPIPCPSPFSFTTFRRTIAALSQSISNNFGYSHCLVSSPIVTSILFSANEQHELCSTNQTSFPHHLLLYHKHYNKLHQWHDDILVLNHTTCVSVPVQFLRDVFLHTHIIHEEGHFCLFLVYH